MGEVPAHASPLRECVRCRPRGIGVRVAEADALVDEIADRLNALPPRRDAAEHAPRDIRQLVGLAIAAAEEIDQHVVGKLGHGDFAGRGVDRIGEAEVAGDAVSRDRRLAGRRHEAAAHVAEAVKIAAHLRGVRADRELVLAHDVGAALGVNVEDTHDGRRPLDRDPHFVTISDEHGDP